MSDLALKRPLLPGDIVLIEIGQEVKRARLDRIGRSSFTGNYGYNCTMLEASHAGPVGIQIFTETIKPATLDYKTGMPYTTVTVNVRRNPCECGAHAVRHARHSQWCPEFNK